MVALLEIILFFIWVCAILGAVFASFMLIRNEYVFKNHMKIVQAINRYADSTGDYDMALTLIARTEGFTKTLWRWWDWGCKNILPKEDYELIRPYLRKGKQK